MLSIEREDRTRSPVVPYLDVSVSAIVDRSSRRFTETYLFYLALNLMHAICKLT